MNKIPESPERPYRVYDRDGRLAESRPASLRHPPHIELSMIEAGYTIKLNGKKITKKEITKK